MNIDRKALAKMSLCEVNNSTQKELKKKNIDKTILIFYLLFEKQNMSEGAPNLSLGWQGLEREKTNCTTNFAISIDQLEEDKQGPKQKS